MPRSPRPDLSCQLAGVTLATPLVLASGIWGTSPSLLERAARAGAGAVTAKTCTPAPRRGHRNPCAVDFGHGLVNAMGLPNPGVEEEVPLLREAARRLSAHDVALIASISADTVDDFGRAAAIVSEAGPALIELNISCPNVESSGAMFASSAGATAAVTRAVKASTSIPCLVKLSPHVPDIAAIARAATEAGADGITAINTMPGMLIDAESGAAVLANVTGGVSGAALKPIALRCVFDVARAVPIPVIGTGGVLTGMDAVEMISAGATGVGIGSAIVYRGEQALTLILEELRAWMMGHGIGSLDAIRGRTLARGSPVTTNPPPIPGWETRHVR